MLGRKKRGAVGANAPGTPSAPGAPPASGIAVTEMTEEWELELADMRAWVASCVAENDPPLDLRHPPTALAVIEALLDRGGIAADDRWQLEALGVVFGDAVSIELGVPWRLITDQWGTVAGLHLGRDDVAYPMSMIAKRVEAAEEIDVRRLFRTATAHMRQLMDRS